MSGLGEKDDPQGIRIVKSAFFGGARPAPFTLVTGPRDWKKTGPKTSEWVTDRPVSRGKGKKE